MSARMSQLPTKVALLTLLDPLQDPWHLYNLYVLCCTHPRECVIRFASNTMRSSLTPQYRIEVTTNALADTYEVAVGLLTKAFEEFEATRALRWWRRCCRAASRGRCSRSWTATRCGSTILLSTTRRASSCIVFLERRSAVGTIASSTSLQMLQLARISACICEGSAFRIQ